MPPLRYLVLLAVALCHLATALPNPPVSRRIADTPGNRKYFNVVRQVIDSDQVNRSCADDYFNQVVNCIKICASVGDSFRDGCCCFAYQESTVFGQAAGCQFDQVLSRDSDSLTLYYKSSPVGSDNGLSATYFKDDCSRSNYIPDPPSCDCTIEWQLSESDLDEGTELPTSGVSPVPRSPRPLVSPTEFAQVSPSTTSTPSASSSLSSSPSPTPSSSASFTPSASSMLSGTVTPLPASPSQTPSVSAFSTPSPEETYTFGLSYEPIPSLPSDDNADSPGSDSQATPSASDEDSSVCVDERYLTQRGYKKEHFVHRQGLVAPVLCPVLDGLPCGTRYHKVRVNGQAMSYAHLCSTEGVKCSSRVMKVNSVWSHMWTDVSHQHVDLTMYDVRYPETAQRLLHRVMRNVRLS